MTLARLAVTTVLCLHVPSRTTIVALASSGVGSRALDRRYDERCLSYLHWKAE